MRYIVFFFFSSRRRHTRWTGDWSSDVCSSDLEVSRQLKEYFAGERTRFELPLRADGDEFQRSVWTEIARIPYGTTVTYGEIAAALDDPSLARDVGAAVGRNPLSILIPCHRVVG